MHLWGTKKSEVGFHVPDKFIDDKTLILRIDAEEFNIQRRVIWISRIWRKNKEWRLGWKLFVDGPHESFAAKSALCNKLVDTFLQELYNS